MNYAIESSKIARICLKHGAIIYGAWVRDVVVLGKDESSELMNVIITPSRMKNFMGEMNKMGNSKILIVPFIIILTLYFILKIKLNPKLKSMK